MLLLKHCLIQVAFDTATPVVVFSGDDRSKCGRSDENELRPHGNKGRKEDATTNTNRAVLPKILCTIGHAFSKTL